MEYRLFTIVRYNYRYRYRDYNMNIKDKANQTAQTQLLFLRFGQIH
jgi:hypothetical protein